MVQLVRLRDPLGPASGSEYCGAWARGAPDWDDLPAREQQRLGIERLPEGEFLLVA